MNFLSVLLTALSFVASSRGTSCPSSCLLQLPDGQVQGKCDNGICSITNIPYAAAPVGNLRFEAPRLNNLQWLGARDGTKAPIPCVQFSKYYSANGGSEACLYVHIYFLDTGIKNREVLAYLHDGDGMYGSPGNYDFTPLIKQGIVVVAINYRLGALGFLSTNNPCIPGNNGLKDQRLALRWINNYCHLFMGSPDKIVLQGDGYAASFAHLHMLRQEKLFSSVILSGGSAFSPHAFQPRPVWRYAEFVTNMNCTTLCPDVIDCIKSKTTQEIVNSVLQQYEYRDMPSILYGAVLDSFSPTPFLTESPESIIKSGRAQTVPLLIVHAARGGSYTAAMWIYLNSEGSARMTWLNERWEQYAPLMLYYNATKTIVNRDLYSAYLKDKYFDFRVFGRNNYCHLEAMFTDENYMAPIRKAICLHRKYGKGKLYVEKYKNEHSFGIGNILSERTNISFGADYGSEGILTHPLNVLKIKNPTENEQRISHRLSLMTKRMANGYGEYAGTSLPLNTPDQSGALIVNKHSHAFEYCQASYCDECTSY